MHTRFMRPSTADDARDLARLTSDGLLRRVVGDVHVSLLEPDDREVRATAAGVLLPPRLLAAGAAVYGPDAVWLHAGGDPPDRLHVALPVRRGRAGTDLVVVHEARLPAGDLEVVAGVTVTVPARAAADVARGLPPGQALPLLHRLAAAVDLDPRDVLVHLERLSGCRGVEAARSTVLGWATGVESARRSPGGGRAGSLVTAPP